jgi:GTPase SAR1 family protein
MVKQPDQTAALLAIIEQSSQYVSLHKQIALQCDVDTEIIKLHEKLIQLLTKISVLVREIDVPDNYLKLFHEDINQALNFLPYKERETMYFPEHLKEVKENIERNSRNLREIVERISFNSDFFKKLGFFKNNIVAVGANGSGKTSLANDLKSHLSRNGVVISAQKILLIPTFSGISNLQLTAQKLQDIQTADKTYKTTYSTENNGNSYQILTQLGGEFQILLDNLLAERSAVRNRFCDNLKAKDKFEDVPTTKFDRMLDIWNSLLPHRTTSCSDGINIMLTPPNGEPYPAYQMSDGEKELLYLVAQVLQAPVSGFIVVDEPEMYLHKTIVNKLWDTLELERKDCIFIYLTHDLDFAGSRVDAKKIWIRSFTFPNQWDIEDIPENEIPEQLLMELLGSRTNILFCEGKNQSLDSKIFNLLFSTFSVYPVGSCFDVINYTKAYNRIPDKQTNAYGIIDRDHHSPERLIDLEKKFVYSFSMAEIENLLLDEEFLIIVARKLHYDQSIVELIKTNVIAQLEKDLEKQIAHYLSAKINYYFHNSHVSQGGDRAEVITNFDNFICEVKITDWYDLRKAELKTLISNQDYQGVLQVYNDKSLKVIVHRHLNTREFTEFSLRIITDEEVVREILKKHFPRQLCQ